MQEAFQKVKTLNYENSGFLNFRLENPRWQKPKQTRNGCDDPSRAVVKFKAGKEMKNGLRQA
jgi:nucleoid DNA-binding protein